MEYALIGNGAPTNKSGAREYFKKAAYQGNEKAQLNRGRCLTKDERPSRLNDPAGEPIITATMRLLT
jgi:TPR repeat protein